MPRLKETKPYPNRIRELRLKAGLKQAHLAVEFDVDQSTIYRWETIGPPVNVVPKLARRLEADPTYMMAWDQEAA